MGDEEKKCVSRLPFDWDNRRSPVLSDWGMLAELVKGFESFRGISTTRKRGGVLVRVDRDTKSQKTLWKRAH